MRKFIRHPLDVPIECRIQQDEEHKKCCARNVSMGGLSFTHGTYIEPKSIIHIKIKISEPAFETDAIVIWCTKENGQYDIGVKFDSDATEFSVRMIEQICHIEHYKNEILKKRGKHLSSEEAASEWIKKYADDFPV